ncbi:hypothetical protein E2C01_027453 [Portunus trituberculatus]|uniref:Uncharacterized protein n=1 Tax=Portunus trituberculatus TaxID=210409 RepID=A0A5B7EL71_PORTR|nr:hypothetical protein [Portunus trituberculatus]
MLLSPKNFFFFCLQQLTQHPTMSWLPDNGTSSPRQLPTYRSQL